MRNAFREELVGWTLREIDDLFQGEEFAPGSLASEIPGQRRSRVEQYYTKVDWTSSHHTARMLRIFEDVLARSVAESRDRLVDVLRRDRFVVDDSGRIHSEGDETLSGLIEKSGLPSGVRAQIDRIDRGIDTDPEAAIGAAKELIEATTKYALDVLKVDYGPAAKVPELLRLAQSALGVHPQSVAPDKRGYETIKVILGSLTQVAIRVNDLRQPYGTGHGRPARVSGLRPRHARLAAGAAAVYCRFLLDTLEDPKAPWQISPPKG